MTLGNLADLAEIISGIAVLITLVFVVIQLRDNTKALRTSALSTHYTDSHDIIADGSRIPELAIAAQKAYTNQPLDGTDNYHLTNWVSRACLVLERSLMLLEDGIIDQLSFDRAALPGKYLLKVPAAREGYQALVRRGMFGPEIKQYLGDFYAELDREAGQISGQIAESNDSCTTFNSPAR